jgi:antitoxin component of RelBE/YafQ-DinJ toxin-antitoxin module
MTKERKSTTQKAVLNMQLDPELLRTGHEMAAEDGISLSGLVRMLLLREKKRRDAEKNKEA